MTENYPERLMSTQTEPHRPNANAEKIAMNASAGNMSVSAFATTKKANDMARINDNMGQLLKDLKEVLEKHDASIEYDIRDKELQIFDEFGNYVSFGGDIEPYLIELKLKAKDNGRT